MKSTLVYFFANFWEASAPVLIAFGIFAAGFAIRKLLFMRLAAWSKTTKTQIDDIIIASIKGPVIVWFLMIGIYAGLEYSRLPERAVYICGKILLVLGIFSITLVLSNIATRIIKTYSGKAESGLPVTSLTQNISRIVIFCIGILIILNSLGVSITPILATLGVGGLAVALALQDTLSNLFSGFHIIAAKQLKLGDYIKLDTGEEGYVIDINWRITKIRMLSGNSILVPNEKLTKANVTNFCQPDKELFISIDVGVDYKSDLRKVERITNEVAGDVMKQVKGGVPGFEPFIRYSGFGDSSVNFTVTLRVREFADQFLVKHEFVIRLHERYGREGIVIPYPVRTVYVSNEK